MPLVKSDRYKVVWNNGKATLIIPATQKQAANAPEVLKDLKHVLHVAQDKYGNVRVQTTLRKACTSQDRLNKMYSTITEALRNPSRPQAQRKRQQYRSKTGPYRRPHRGTLRTLLPTT